MIELWLKGNVADDKDVETNRVLQQASLEALQPSSGVEERVLAIQLPESPINKRQVEKFLAPLNPITVGSTLRVNGSSYIRYFQKELGFPLLRSDMERREVLLGINGTVHKLTESLPDPAVLTQSLQHIEDYLNTVDLGQSSEPTFAKTSMFEALLYVLSSPFAHEHMKARRQTYGVLDTRGPRFLYIYGPSHNGKSTFLTFSLKLLIGQQIQPLPGRYFTKRRITNALSIGSAFPLLFDDVTPSQQGGFEEVLKSYWEVWWRADHISPQLILSSNAKSLKDWAKSRVKRVDFDVYFAPDAQNKAKLAEIFRHENKLFHWFAHLYMQNLAAPAPPSDDELYLARISAQQLYEQAKRPLPDFFPREPIEKLYDAGRREWMQLVKLGKVKITPDNNSLRAEFTEDMQFWDVNEYESYLPQTVKHKKKGNTLIIESPREFRTWLEGHTRESRSLFGRLLQALVRR